MKIKIIGADSAFEGINTSIYFVNEGGANGAEF